MSFGTPEPGVIVSEGVVSGLFVLAGAVLGAVLTGSFAWYQHRRSRRRSELSILTTLPTRLIEIDSSVAQVVEILVRGNRVPAVYTLDARVVNTGTEPVGCGDVKVALDGDTRVLAVDVARCPAGAEERIGVAADAAEPGFRLDFDFLNPGEVILVRSLLSARPAAVTPTFRQRGVNVRVRSDEDPAIPGVLGRALFEAIRSTWFLHLLFLMLPPYRSFLAEVDREDGAS